jgi:hypothetical protein
MSSNICIRHAVSYFTKEYARSNKGGTTVRYDGCNGFVYYGGIVWIVLVSAALFPVCILLAGNIYDRRKAGSTPNAVLLNESPTKSNVYTNESAAKNNAVYTTESAAKSNVYTNESAAKNNAVYTTESAAKNNAVYPPRRPKCEALPNAEGFFLPGSFPAFFNISFVRRLFAPRSLHRRGQRRVSAPLRSLLSRPRPMMLFRDTFAATNATAASLAMAPPLFIWPVIPP